MAREAGAGYRWFTGYDAVALGLVLDRLEQAGSRDEQIALVQTWLRDPEAGR